MDLSAGSVFVRLFGVVDDSGFSKYKREIAMAKLAAAQGATAKLDTETDWSQFSRWKQSIKDIGRDSARFTKDEEQRSKQRAKAEKLAGDQLVLQWKNNSRQFDQSQKANQRSLEDRIKNARRAEEIYLDDLARKEAAAAASSVRRDQRVAREKELIARELAASRAQAERDAEAAINRRERLERAQATQTLNRAKALNREVERQSRDIDRAMGGGRGGSGGGNTNFRKLGDDANHGSAGIKRFASALNPIPSNLFAIQTRIPLIGWGVMAAGVASVIPLIVSLSSALGPIAGLLGGLPGLVLTAGGAFAALSLGLKGIGGALTTAWQAQNAASADSAKSADRAQDAVRKVADAERTLADAERDAKSAQTDLNQSRQDARDRIRDMRLEVERSALAEKGASLSLSEAYEALGRAQQDGTTTSLELARARLSVQEAEQGLDDTRRDGVEKANDLHEAEKKGIQRAPEVISARKQLADAERSVADASRGIGEAHRDANRMNEALSASTDQLATKMANLSPAGKSFVNFVRKDLFPVVKHLQSVAQEGLLPGVEKGVRAAMTNIPMLTNVVSLYSVALGDAAKKQGEFLGKKDTGDDLWLILKNGEGFIRKLTNALMIFEGGLLDVGVAARPLVTWLGDISVKLAKMFAQWAESGRESGKLEEFFKRSIRNTELFVGALWHFTRGLINIGRIARQVWGQDMLGGINDVAKRFEEWTTSVRGARDITRYFERWRDRWEGIEKAVSGVITRYRHLRREGKSVSEALITMFAEVASKIIVSLAYNIGKGIPIIVKSFVDGFLDSDYLGKLVITGWLIKHFGGYKAFAAIGKRVALMFASTFVASAGPVAATGTLAEIAGPKMAARWAAAGALTGTLFAAGMVALIGAVVAQGLRKLKTDVIDPFMKKTLGQKIGGFLGGARDFIGKNYPTGAPGSELLHQVFGAGNKGKDQADDMKKSVKGIADAADKINPKGLKALRQEMGLIPGAAKPAKGSINDVADTAQKRFGKDGVKSAEDWKIAIREMVRDSRGKLGDMKTNVQFNTRLIKEALRDESGAGRRALAKNMESILKTIKHTMTRGGEVTDKGLALIKKLYVNELLFYGLNPRQAVASANVRTGEVRAGNRGKYLSDLAPDTGATGGWIGAAAAAYRGGGRIIGKLGERGRDLVHAVLGRGEAVLNFPQQKIVNTALRMAGVKGLPGLFNMTRGTKHHMASGGVAGEEPQGYAPGGIVGIPNSPGMSIDRRILPDVMRLKSRYRAHVNAGYDLTGHAANGEHPLGLAVDWVPEFTKHGSWDLIDSFAHWAEPSQGSPRPPFRWVGYDGDYNHGRGNHLHTSWDHGPGNPPAWVKTLQGKVIGQTMAKIKRVIIQGRDSPLKSTLQGVMDNARRAANKRASRILSRSSFGGAEFGGVPSGDGDSAENRLLGMKMANQFHSGWGHGAEWRALDDLWGRLEGSWDENLANMEGSGAYGIAQALPASKYPAAGEPSAPPGFKKAAAQIGWGLNYIQDTYGDPIGAHAARIAKGWYGGGGFADAGGMAEGGFAADQSGGQSLLAAGIPFAGSFATGGYVGGGGMLTKKGTKFRSGANKVITGLEHDIEDLGDRYSLDSQWGDLDEEEFINEGTETTPPSLNQEAIEKRLNEIRKLIATRDKITHKYQRMIRYMEKLLNVYRTMRRRLHHTIEGIQTHLGKLKGRKGKEANRSRSALVKRLGIYRGTLQGVNEDIHDLGPRLDSAKFEEESSRIDRAQLKVEAAPLKNHGAGIELPDWEPPDATADQTAIADQQRNRADSLSTQLTAVTATLQAFASSGDLGRLGSTALSATVSPTGRAGLGYVVGPTGSLIPIVSGSGTQAPAGGGYAGGGTATTTNNYFTSTVPYTREQAAMVAGMTTAGIEGQSPTISPRISYNL